MRLVRVEILLAAVLAVLTVAAFWHVPHCDFVNYDDQDYAYDNPRVQAGLTWEGVRWAWTTTFAANWHPLTWLSLQADRTLYGAVEPHGFHRTNLLLHVGGTLLAFLAFRVLTGAVWRSALVAALFAVHPLHVESVAWVSERKDVLSTFFWMLTLLAYGWYARRPGLGRYTAVMASFALGLLAKPMLVTLPCVLLLLDYWPLRRHVAASRSGKDCQPGWHAFAAQPGPSEGILTKTGPREHGTLPERVKPVKGVDARRVALLVAEKLPLFALAAASCVMTWWAQQSGGAVRTFQQYSFSVRVANAVVAYAEYLGKTFLPDRLAVFYPHPGNSLSAATLAGAAALLAALTALCLLAVRRYPYLAVGWLWYLGTLVPVIGLVQVGEQALADRYTYIPLLGVFLAVAWGVGDVVQRWPFLRAGLALTAVVLLVACARLTWLQVKTWENSRALWTHALEVTAGNWLAHSSLAMTIGPTDPEGAVEELKQAIRLRPGDTNVRNNLGFYLDRCGRKEEAAQCFREVLDAEPRHFVAHYNLAGILAEQGCLAEARRHLEQAVRLDPKYAKAHNRLGEVCMRLGETAAAVESFRRAVELQPDDARYLHNLDRALKD
jgi:tetratricopeptide (TPR) repeat protein